MRQPQPGENFMEYQKETRRFMILFLNDMTRLSNYEICNMLGMTKDSHVVQKAKDQVNDKNYVEFRCQLIDMIGQK